jgi:predicted solute-binding protein
MPVRLGAVGYLNARPLTWALDRDPARWHVRYDVPAVCADRLHAGEVDLGLVPSIEYLASEVYQLVPGVGIGSAGPVASVALFSKGPVSRIRRVTLDTSSRTSIVLLKVLCRERFRIDPAFVPLETDGRGLESDQDAALLIGDPAFDLDHAALGLQKTDLGAEWTQLTGLPFIYAAWTGRPGAVSPADAAALQRAQEEGVAARSAIAAEYAGGNAAVAARADAYLRDNVRFGLGPREAAGLQAFLDYAFAHGFAPRRRRLEFYETERERVS